MFLSYTTELDNVKNKLNSLVANNVGKKVNVDSVISNNVNNTLPPVNQNAPGILWADVVSSPTLDEAFTLVKRHNKRPRLNVSLEVNNNGGTTSINNNGETTSNNNNENTANIKTAKKPTKVISKKVVEDCKLRADKNLIKKSVFSMSNISKCHRRDVVEFLTSNGINVITCYPVLKKTEISSDKNFDKDDQESTMFRVCIDSSDVDKMKDPDIMLKNIIVREWRFNQTKPDANTLNGKTSIRKQSVIDNIFVNCLKPSRLNGVVMCDLSDHFPIFASIDDGNRSIDVKDSTQMTFSFSRHHLRRLNERLQFSDWSEVFDCIDVDMGFELFINRFQSYFYDACLIKSNRKKNKLSKQKLWFTAEFKKLLKKKKCLFKIYLKNPSEDGLLKFKTCSKLCTNLKNKLKRRYYTNQIEQNINNSKKTWSIIKEVSNRSSSNKTNLQVTSNEQIIENPENFLNDYFINIAPNLLKSFQTNNQWKKFLGNKIPNSFFCLHASAEEIIFATKLLAPKSSSGWDNIPTKIVISTIHSTAWVLEHITNRSLTTVGQINRNNK
ncbi:hypothetical protein HELRODRAFT_178169 [Helobdella robusta]|uniref:Endonuclease/exonuclease/phosphatase domain-containing protein n=1 Tax=Helobdella robusta TaxID=6412 RepID=T1FCV6_HELRO|nr:hypothetical protein HELRODRAFT_178169 [Helobdella robusta]ESN97378.1 hypothetical protein HELRODRAFT_178169 [Helobdella robusta]